MKNYWAVRTSRDNDKSIKELLDELHNGKLRQGWGYQSDQDLTKVLSRWEEGKSLSEAEKEARRHWRMGNGIGEDYMQKGDLVLVPNTPEYGRFTICKVTEDYYFEIGPSEDFGHIRPVKVLTPKGIANNHELVHADLRRSLRCRLRMWNIYAHRASLKRILGEIKKGGSDVEDSLVLGSTPIERAEKIISKVMDTTRDKIAKKISSNFRAEEFETVLQAALEHLFPVSVHHTGGPAEKGADLEIVIRNPFVGDGEKEWIVPVQVKDHVGEEGAEAANQLEKAFHSRSETGHVIAVVLLVSDAEVSKELEESMRYLSNQHNVPFIYCGKREFRKILSDGLFLWGSNRIDTP